MAATPPSESGCGSEEPHGRLPGWAIGFVVAGSLADGWTTHQAFERGAIEANPAYAPLGERRMMVVHAALITGTLIGLSRLARTRPRLAKGIALVMGGIGFAAAAHNVGVCREEGRCSEQ